LTTSSIGFQEIQAAVKWHELAHMAKKTGLEQCVIVLACRSRDLAQNPTSACRSSLGVGACRQPRKVEAGLRNETMNGTLSLPSNGACVVRP
jgi:hypothetical protein